MITIGIFDWVIWLVYLTLIWVVCFVYKLSRKDQELYRYFMSGLSVKVLGGVAFALLYLYYYGFGDTFLYHNGAGVLAQSLLESPSDYFKLIFTEAGNFPPDLAEYRTLIPYSRTGEEWLMVKLLSPISFISFNSYLVVTLFTSIISFFGSWKLFLVFKDIFKSGHKWAFAAAFLIPSVLFWGSGILKDTFTLAAFNYLIYLVYNATKKQEFGIYRLLMIALMTLLIFNLKSYIILSFLPCLMVILYFEFQAKIKSTVVRYLMGPIILSSFIGFIFLSLSSLSESSSKYKIEELEQQAKGFHSWHTTTAGSSYNLGEIEYTPAGVVRKIPAALNVTFFRPYLWESRNIVMIISALESVFFFLIFVMTIGKLRFGIFKKLKTNPYMLGLFVFCLVFGFAIGFTSYNFGALMRYKIPISSLIFFIFFLLYFEKKKDIEKGDNKL